jgi:hypothetical protein
MSFEASQGLTEIVSTAKPCAAVELVEAFDAFGDRKAAHMMSASRQVDRIALGRLMVEEKSNEIPAAPDLIEALGVKDCVFSLDAEHTQKNI